MSQEYTDQQTQIPENTDAQSQDSINQSNTDSQTSQNQKMFTEEEVKKMIDDRLKNKEMEHKRKTDAVMKRIAELESKEKAGTATPEERTELSTGKGAQAQAQQQGVHPDAIPYIIDEEMAKQKFLQNIKDAQQKDPEFKALLTPESKRLVNDDQLFFIRDLPNAPAVFKTLLANKKENNLMQAKFQEMIYKQEPSIMVQYINDLSDRLEKTSTSPRAPSYTPDANLSDLGDSAQDFDLKKYIQDHR